MRFIKQVIPPIDQIVNANSDYESQFRAFNRWIEAELVRIDAYIELTNNRLTTQSEALNLFKKTKFEQTNEIINAKLALDEGRRKDQISLQSWYQELRRVDDLDPHDYLEK